MEPSQPALTRAIRVVSKLGGVKEVRASGARGRAVQISIHTEKEGERSRGGRARERVAQASTKAPLGAGAHRATYRRKGRRWYWGLLKFGISVDRETDSLPATKSNPNQPGSRRAGERQSSGPSASLHTTSHGGNRRQRLEVRGCGWRILQVAGGSCAYQHLHQEMRPPPSYRFSFPFTPASPTTSPYPHSSPTIEPLALGTTQLRFSLARTLSLSLFTHSLAFRRIPPTLSRPTPCPRSLTPLSRVRTPLPRRKRRPLLPIYIAITCLLSHHGIADRLVCNAALHCVRPGQCCICAPSLSTPHFI